MRAIPQPLASHLAGGATTLCRCWLLVRRDGTAFGFTDHDRDLTFDGQIYSATSGLAPSEVESQLGLAVSTGEIGGALTDARLTEADIIGGRYDDAEITTWLVNWADVSQRLMLDGSTIGEIRRMDQSFVAELRGPLHRYDQEQGRLYTQGCTADLGDAACGIDLAARAVTAAVTATDGRLNLTVAAIAATAASHFAGGRAELLTGANAGLTRAIQTHGAGGTLALWEPLPQSLAVGDSLRLTPGCDKSFATCGLKFVNAANFRGFPHIPTPDFILTYARPGEGGHDGGPLDP
ncbi:MAG TPA: DUF2163 domain-containing protein [Beijerinckiaceae bacterium]|nr:DUF2163 domain-containing protein [Beijerinckiaceae bacterium]